MKRSIPVLALTLALGPLACTDDGGDEGLLVPMSETSGDGTTSGDGDGDGTTSGDGDGDGTTSGDGDGDGTTSGDGDGDPVACGMDPGWGQVEIGQPVKHVAAKDASGAAVNLCEWGGTPIALDAAAVWCGPCKLASEFLSTGAGQDPFSGLGPDLKAAIDGGKIVWVTALLEDVNGGPGTVADASAWDMEYPNPNIPVIVEDDVPMLSGYLPGNCVPRVFVIDPNLNFWALDDCQTWNHLATMLDEWGG